jgi:hypothetical protein
MALRKLTREELAGLKVGDEVAVRYFDPNGPSPDENQMTTERGVVHHLAGDPLDNMMRTVIVQFPNRWHEQRYLDYFGSSLLKED